MIKYEHNKNWSKPNLNFIASDRKDDIGAFKFCFNFNFKYAIPRLSNDDGVIKQ